MEITEEFDPMVSNVETTIPVLLTEEEALMSSLVQDKSLEESKHVFKMKPKRISKPNENAIASPT